MNVPLFTIGLGYLALFQLCWCLRVTLVPCYIDGSVDVIVAEELLCVVRVRGTGVSVVVVIVEQDLALTDHVHP